MRDKWSKTMSKLPYNDDRRGPGSGAAENDLPECALESLLQPRRLAFALDGRDVERAEIDHVDGVGDLVALTPPKKKPRRKTA